MALNTPFQLLRDPKNVLLYFLLEMIIKRCWLEMCSVSPLRYAPMKLKFNLWCKAQRIKQV